MEHKCFSWNRGVAKGMEARGKHLKTGKGKSTEDSLKQRLLIRVCYRGWHWLTKEYHHNQANILRQVVYLEYCGFEEFPASFYNVQSLEPRKDVRRLKKCEELWADEMSFIPITWRYPPLPRQCTYIRWHRVEFSRTIHDSTRHCILGHTCC